MDVATQKKEKPQSCKPANAAWRDAKYRMRKGKHTAAAMALVKTSDASEQQQLHKYVMMLQSSSGRAKLIEMLDAKIEHAAGVDGVPTSSEDDGPSNDCVRQPVQKIIARKPVRRVVVERPAVETFVQVTRERRARRKPVRSFVRRLFCR